jgi:fibronectin type 3 domain-containing protein
MGFTRVLVGILFLVLLHNPAPVLGVTLPGSYSVALAWQPSSSTNVTSYRVYYGTSSGNYTNSVLVGMVMTNTVSGLASGVTDYFAITVIGADGQESAFSNEINYMPGVPTVRMRIASAKEFVLTVSYLIGHTYQVQATQDFKAWTTIGTATLDASGSLDFTDTNAASFTHRFYRTQETP